ncbi:MAG: hypothetical protein M3401_19330 [Actinomycetota bacterium]|nr:hypothetical protein [Actinomycetota bacterium]
MHGRRDIGRVGTLARVIGGVALVGVPIAEHGISWWDAGGALIALPLIAFVVAGVLRLRQARAAGAAATRGQAITAIAVVIAVGSALTFVTPIDQVAIWAFFGISMLLAALRGYAGCELLAIPNALTSRRDQLDCFIYTPIDTAEATRVRAGAPKAST